LKVTKLGILVMVAAVALVLGAFRPGIEPDRAEASLVAVYAVPSAIPTLAPALAPASAPGNLAVVGVDCGDRAGCPIHTDTGTDDITFTLTRYHPSGAPAARFAANGGTTLVCDERTAPWVAGDTDCDVDTVFVNGNVAVQVDGGGENEVVNVEACDQTGDCRTTSIIFVETIFAVSPLHAAASFSPTLVSYACPVRSTVLRDWQTAPGADVDGLVDLEDSVTNLIPSFVAGEILPPTTSMNLPPDFGPKWRCGTADNSPENRVTFETDAGMLSVQTFQNPITISSLCRMGDSVDVIDYPGWVNLPVPLGPGPAPNQCDLSIFGGIVAYGLEGTGDVGVATLTAQQLGGAGPLRTINVAFVGLGALSLMMDVPDLIGMEGGLFSVVVVDPDLRFLEGQTLECTAEPKEAVLAIIPQTATTGAFPEPFAYFTLYPTFTAVQAGVDVTVTCALASNPDVTAAATARIGSPQLEGVDDVPLVAGCNPVSSTWPDGTDVSAVADGVAPPDALDAIWAYDTATGNWLGYSPEGPEGVSDLESIDRLDAIFICVDADATVSRPAI